MMYISKKGSLERKKRERLILLIFLILILLLSLILFLLGDEIYPITTLFKVLMGERVQGASYAIKTIRMPRVIIGILSGFAFGVSGNVFQKLLRNPLASVDVMGITSGASAAAVFTMMILGFSGLVVSISAIIGGVLTATIILWLARKKQFPISKMILSGIGLQAMLQAFINFIILKTSDYNISEALRWLSGSLNGVRMHDVPVFLLIVILLSACLCILEKDLLVLMLGDDISTTLGVNIVKMRFVMIYCAVILATSSIAITGPLSSVAFMSGHIASRILKTGNIGTIHAGMMGSIIVLFSEIVGQFLFATRYPVGVITGIIGAPYLIYLLIKMNRMEG